MTLGQLRASLDPVLLKDAVDVFRFASDAGPLARGDFAMKLALYLHTGLWPALVFESLSVKDLDTLADFFRMMADKQEPGSDFEWLYLGLESACLMRALHGKSEEIELDGLLRLQ